MKSTKLSYSKNQIDKAGHTLVQKNINKEQLEQAFKVLSAWRSYHTIPLNTFAEVLKNRVKKVQTSEFSIVAQRLKRAPSVLLKLKVHKTMRLSTMQDIGGLRAIIDDVKGVYNLLDLYKFSKTKHTLFTSNDYIKSPKKDGYRGVHLVYKLSRTPSIFLEIQIRSLLQHIWATGVEVFGTLQKSSFKSGLGEKKWLELFTLLSSVFALKENTPPVECHRQLTKETLLERTKELIHELKAIEQLNVYTNLYKIKLSTPSKGRGGSYNLISLNSDKNTVTIQNFSVNQIEEANEAYLQFEQKYFKRINMNVVLVKSGDIKKLEASYPNYFMDTKKLLKILSLISIDKYL